MNQRKLSNHAFHVSQSKRQRSKGKCSEPDDSDQLLTKGSMKYDSTESNLYQSLQQQRYHNQVANPLHIVEHPGDRLDGNSSSFSGFRRLKTLSWSLLSPHFMLRTIGSHMHTAYRVIKERYYDLFLLSPIHSQFTRHLITIRRTAAPD